MPHAEAVRRLREGSGRQWDPRVVAAFVKWTREHDARAPLVAVPIAHATPSGGAA